MESYNKDVLKCINPGILFHPLFDEWILIVDEILRNDEFQKRKVFMHHHNISVWDHSILVSFKSFLVAKWLHADCRVAAVAGLLHDFYTQAWIDTPEIENLDGGKYAVSLKEKKSLFKMHGFTHARDAAINYVIFFPNLENKKVTNAIKYHMFPLNILPPRYIEGIIITLVDKYSSCHELPSIRNMISRVLNKCRYLISNKGN